MPNNELVLREHLALQRTALANQSTFLSFLRTSMYFLVAGVSMNNLLSISWGEWIEVSFIVVAVFLLTIGVINYRYNAKRIASSKKQIGSVELDLLRDQAND